MTPTYDPILDDDSKENKQKYWEVAFGLQAVDDLKPSKYVQGLAREHIEGTKTYQEVTDNTREYYNSPTRDQNEKEADIVAEAIYDILHDGAFRFDIATLKSYHYRLFKELDNHVFHPSEFRTVNLTKKEPILNGESVQYQDYGLIEQSLRYDFDQESQTDYLSLSQAQKVSNLSSFTAHIWQVHPFYEGNTRTTAIFIEKYLMSLGYQIDNEVFGTHSKDFRNALVLANYTNIPKGIQADPTTLIKFFAQILAE